MCLQEIFFAAAVDHQDEAGAQAAGCNCSGSNSSGRLMVILLSDRDCKVLSVLLSGLELQGSQQVAETVTAARVDGALVNSTSNAQPGSPWWLQSRNLQWPRKEQKLQKAVVGDDGSVQMPRANHKSLGNQ